MNYDIWTKKLDDIHFSKRRNSDGTTLCGKPMLGNNYNRDYKEIDVGYNLKPRSVCIECAQELANRLTLLEQSIETHGGVITHDVVLESGNHIRFFVNREKNLVVMDLVAKNFEGGFEFFREIIDERAMLGHVHGINPETMKDVSDETVLILTDTHTIEQYHIKGGLKFPVPEGKKTKSKSAKLRTILDDIEQKVKHDDSASHETISAKLLLIEELVWKAKEIMNS